MAGKKVSMKEVSARSGVSIATVSRVIHGNGRFSDETAQRVLQVMRELEYTPDPLAQGMRKKAMPVIGMIVPDILDDRYGNMVRTAQDAFFRQGYTTVVFNSNEDDARSQSFIDSLSGQHASGLMYIPGARGGGIDMRDLPAVFVERRPPVYPESPHVQVLLDDFEAAREAAARLTASGRTRILLLGDRTGISSFQARAAGAGAALEAAGLRAAGMVPLDPQRTSETVSALSSISMSGYDAVFCLSIRMTVGALKVLKDQGISRQQVRVVGIGEHRLLKYGLLEYDAVHEPVQEMAELAAGRMIDLIRGTETQPEYMLKCSLPDWKTE